MVPYSLAELFEEGSNQGREDLFDSDFIELSICDNIVVAHEPRSDCRTTPARRAHGGEDDDILQVHESEIFAVKPSLVIHKLSEEFNWRLSPKFFLFGHIEIVNKYNISSSDRWSVVTFSSFIKF